MDRIGEYRSQRIIGKPDKDFRVCVEDYVKSYMVRMCQDSAYADKVEVLFGRFRTDGECMEVDIRGAGHLFGIGDIILMKESVQLRIDELNSKYFSELEPIGWFYNKDKAVKNNYSLLMDVHETLFGENGGVLIIPGKDMEEPEVYDYAEDGFRRLKGYTVYYEKNTEMQEYLLDSVRLNGKRRVNISRQRSGNAEDVLKQENDINEEVKTYSEGGYLKKHSKSDEESVSKKDDEGVHNTEAVNKDGKSIKQGMSLSETSEVIRQRVVGLSMKIKEVSESAVAKSREARASSNLSAEAKGFKIKRFSFKKMKEKAVKHEPEGEGQETISYTGLAVTGMLVIAFAGLLTAFKTYYYTNFSDTVEYVKEFIRYCFSHGG